MMPMNELESEIKLTLDRAGWLKLQRCLPIEQQFEQKNHFYDDAARTLSNSHWALRLREQAGRHFLAAKGPAEYSDHVVQRQEIEVELSSDDLELIQRAKALNELPFKPCHVLIELFGNLEVSPFFQFSNFRMVLNWEQELLELDQSLCLSQERYELEWESNPANLKQKFPQLQSWLKANEINFSASNSGKLSWAIAISSS